MSRIPAPELKAHVIITGADGVIEEPDGQRVHDMVEAMVASGRGVLHFHGGLVAETHGLRSLR